MEEQNQQRNAERREDQEPRKEQLYSMDAEVDCLRAALSGEEEPLTMLVADLSPEDFYVKNNRDLFHAIAEAAEDHNALDPTIIAVTAGEEIGDYAKHVRSGPLLDPPTLRGRASIVHSLSLQRKMIYLSGQLAQGLRGSQWRDAAWKFYDGLVEVTATDPASNAARGLGAYRDSVMQGITAARENEGIVGMRCGIWPIDQGFGGIQKGRMTVVGARPGMGKTLVTRQIAKNVAHQGHKVLICDTEMLGRDNMQRLALAHAGVPWIKLEEGTLSLEDIRKIDAAMDEIAELPMFIDDAGRQTVASIRRQVIRYKPDLLIVDYLQQLTPAAHTRDSREREVGGMLEGINQLKKFGDDGTAVILVAQLNRGLEARTNKRPMLSDLRDSGVIEQGADHALFLYRDHMYNPHRTPPEEIEILCKKNRHGSLWEETMYLVPGAMWVDDRAEYRPHRPESQKGGELHVLKGGAQEDQLQDEMVRDAEDFEDIELDLDDD